MSVSLFNDVIGPVMRGPSSSHCAAALRIGRLARDLMAADFDDVLVEFDRGGLHFKVHVPDEVDFKLDIEFEDEEREIEIELKL